MTEADAGRFKRCLGELSAAHGKTVTEARADAYWKALKDCPIDLLEAAVTHSVKYDMAFPLPARLRRHIDAITFARAKDGRLLPPGTEEHADPDACPDCEGTEGWQYRHCDGDENAKCPFLARFPQIGAHNPHDYVVRCKTCLEKQRGKRRKTYGPKEKSRYRKDEE